MLSKELNMDINTVVTDYKNFNVSNLNAKTPSFNSKGDLILNMESEILIRTPPIQLHGFYGIPKIDDYHKDDTDRQYLIIPLDKDSHLSELFVNNVVLPIDKKIGSK